MIIDTHAHFTPQSTLEALKSRGKDFPNVEMQHKDDHFRLSFVGGELTRPLSPKLRDADQRLAWLDENKIDGQVCGGWLDSFGYELPPEEGAAWSRFLNEPLMLGTQGPARLAPWRASLAVRIDRVDIAQVEPAHPVDLDELDRNLLALGEDIGHLLYPAA